MRATVAEEVADILDGGSDSFSANGAGVCGPLALCGILWFARHRL